ncbi:hypothetical protein JTB14_009758 [Gonioctena quinquepunctata]|nr:hypothetical protein JTB14_009758 [Gonioctena quinquepunctata]
MSCLYVLFCVATISSVTAISDLPAHFPRCKRSDPKLEECLLAATEKVRPDLIKGVPDLFPSIVNFTVPKIVVEQGNRAVNLKASLNDLILTGLDNYKFSRFKFDIANQSFTISVDLPHIILRGEYAVDGKLFFAPIKGKGHFFVELSNSSCFIYHTIKIENRNGVDFIKPLITIPTMNIGKVVDFELTGLFRENQDLEKATKNVIDNNLDVIIDELMPAVEKVLGKMFDDIIFKSLTRIPYDKLYPK